MRAAYVIICLALAQHAVGSILRRPAYTNLDYSAFQPLDNIDDTHQQLMQLLQQQVGYPLHYHQHKHQHGHKKHASQQLNHYNQPASDENSNESKEGRTYINDNQEYAAPLYADNNEWNQPLYAVMRSMADEQPAHGDMITWRGVNMAVGPNSPIKNKKDIEKIFADAQMAMKHINKDQKMAFHQQFAAAVQTNIEDVEFNATQLLQKHQYPVEEHDVTTADGYILKLFRIAPKQAQENQMRPSVLLTNALLGSADDWLLTGPGQALAYMLSDAGFDVWLGNTRGSKYSRRHVSKHPAQPDFWQFSNDEIALFDLPAMIDYVLKTSNNQKLYYVGYSLGTTAFFALASARPEYNDKIIAMYALSPMVYMSNVRSPLLRMMAPNSPFYQQLNEQLGQGEFKPQQELIHTVGGEMCEIETGCKNVCSNVNFVMSGVNTDNLDANMIPVILGHLPAGASVKQMKHYGQAVASQEFRKYDYGSEINQKVYGARFPPKYNLENVKVPVVLMYSNQDWMAHPNDIHKLETELPSVQQSYQVPVDYFTHMDFQYSKEAPKVVYQQIIESIKQNLPY